MRDMKMSSPRNQTVCDEPNSTDTAELYNEKIPSDHLAW